MSNHPEQHLSLENIAAPASPPPDSPDAKAAAETKDLDLAAKRAKLSPMAKYEHAREGMIALLNSDRDRLLEENASARGELDRLRPKYAELNQARRSANLVNILSTIGIAIGGAAISSAGYCDDVTSKWLVFGSGGGLLLAGLAQMTVFTWKGWPPTD